MNVFKKLSKVVVSFLGMINLFIIKVFALGNDFDMLYPKSASMYAVDEPRYKASNTWKIVLILIVPIALFIGIITYLAKGKGSLLKKIIISVILILIYIIAMLIFRYYVM